MIEQWVPWLPDIGLQGKYKIKKLTKGSSGLIITLHMGNDENLAIEIVCKPYAQAYRYHNEQLRLSALRNQLSQKYGEDFHENYTFFQILDSEYLAWLDEESGTMSSYYGIMHFCVLAENGVVDIGIDWEPTIRYLPLKPEA